MPEYEHSWAALLRLDTRLKNEGLKDLQVSEAPRPFGVTLRKMAPKYWPSDPQPESGRFARIESYENTILIHFHNVRAIRANRLKPAIRSNLKLPRNAIRKEGVQIRNFQAI